MKKKRVFGLMTAAGCALFAASAMGAASNVVSNDFETAVGPLAEGDGWTGYGTITATNYTGFADNTVGRPIAGGSNVLAVEGRVTRIAATTANSATVDMMVQIALPDDDLAFPANTTTSDIQIAVGVDKVSGSDSLGKLRVWCQPPAGGTAAWYDLGTTQYTKDTWHRVSFTFDYEHQLCQIRVDGDPVITANGILNADSNLPGGWYKLATSTTSTALASVQVIGSTSIDDLLVSEAATVNDALPVLADAAGSTGGVPNSWIEGQGITRDQATTGSALDDSGMTIADKYAAGYDVADGKKFGVKEMTLTNSVATVTFDAATVQPGYSYVLSTSTDNSTWTDGSAIDATKGTVSITLDAAVKYLKLKVVK